MGEGQAHEEWSAARRVGAADIFPPWDSTIVLQMASPVLFRCLERFEKHLSIAGESGAVDDIGQLHTGSIPVSLVYREKHSDQLGARPRNGNERDNRDKENCRERNQRV